MLVQTTPTCYPWSMASQLLLSWRRLVYDIVIILPCGIFIYNFNWRSSILIIIRIAIFSLYTICFSWWITSTSTAPRLLLAITGTWAVFGGLLVLAPLLHTLTSALVPLPELFKLTIIIFQLDLQGIVVAMSPTATTIPSVKGSRVRLFPSILKRLHLDVEYVCLARCFSAHNSQSPFPDPGNCCYLPMQTSHTVLGHHCPF
jgi:hypothetical protein